MRRRLALLAAAALTAATTSWTVHAQTTDSSSSSDAAGNGGNNDAVAVNTKNGSSVFDIAFSVVRASGDTVANQNIAFAYASCTSCQTVAIAFQVVLITGDPSTVTPVNEAVAINYQCTLCSTMADAVQFVVSTSGPVTFTAEGRREIADIRRRLEKLRHADLSLDQLAAIVEQLRNELAQVLATQLVPLPVGHDDGAASPTPEPSPVATSTATATAPPSATPSSTESASPSPQATATATPTP